jgi:hypothetical protein
MPHCQNNVAALALAQVVLDATTPVEASSRFFDAVESMGARPISRPESTPAPMRRLHQPPIGPPVDLSCADRRSNGQGVQHSTTSVSNIIHCSVPFARTAPAIGSPISRRTTIPRTGLIGTRFPKAGWPVCCARHPMAISGASLRCISALANATSILPRPAPSSLQGRS